MMRDASAYSSQQLSAYEKRMTTSVIRLNVALARDIDARWTYEPMSIIAELLVRWRGNLSTLIFRFHETICRDSMGFIFSTIGQKSQQLEFLLNFIRPELRRHGDKQAAIIEQYLRDRIAKELASGSTQKEVRDRVSNILRSRGYARRIAHTEAHTALERGMWEAANSLGARITKEWFSREDALVRPAHAIAHGQIQFIDTPFQVGGEALMYPGIATASARNRVNCRCTANYRLD